MTKSILIESLDAYSLNKITNGLKNYLSSFFDIRTKESPKWWKTDIYLQHYVVPIKNYMESKRKILIQPLDGTVLSETYISCMKQYDEIITPSHNNKIYLLKNGINKVIHVVPNFYDEFNDNGFFNKIISDNKYTFYNESTGIRRKNVFNTVLYFLEEFTELDNVRLIIKINNDKSKEIIDLVNTYPKHAEVIILNEYLEDEDLYSIMLNIDCYLCLSYMEGFCLPLLNAAVLKKDIITLNTNISGYSDFINSDNAFLLDVKEIPIDTAPESLLMYDVSSIWEEPNYSQYKETLRKFYKGEIVLSKTSNLLKYSKENVMKEYINILNI